MRAQDLRSGAAQDRTASSHRSYEDECHQLCLDQCSPTSFGQWSENTNQARAGDTPEAIARDEAIVREQFKPDIAAAIIESAVFHANHKVIRPAMPNKHAGQESSDGGDAAPEPLDSRYTTITHIQCTCGERVPLEHGRQHLERCSGIPAND